MRLKMSIETTSPAKNNYRSKKRGDHVPLIGVVNDDLKNTSKIMDESLRGITADATSIFKTPTSCNNSLIKTPAAKLGRSIKVSTPVNQSMTKCKSTPVVSEKHAYLSKSMCKDKSVVTTPVTHLCSPSLSPKGRRHFVHHNKCSVKRFLSDSSLSGSATPDHVDGSITDETVQNAQPPEDETSNFLVAVRVRPLNFRELSDASIRNVVQMNDQEVQLTCDSGTIHSFSYDHCFWSLDTNHPQHATQETVFNTMVQPLIDQVFLGYNACLLAYGQTGSGKSYSMMGLDSGNQNEPGPDAGVIPRFCHELFQRISRISEEGGPDCLVEISYFEIYNEKIHDLLGVHSSQSVRRTPLKVREHPTFGPYVVDLSAHCVRSFQDVQGWLTVGNSQRVTAATGMNEKSSRSHSIFSIMLTQKEKEEEGCLHSCRSKINLVDLAGSERVAQTCATGHKLKEGVSINKSLLSLGKVITFLSEKGKKKGVPSFGPYRESVLTWLLRESLGGNSRTAMLATISPANIHVDETLATLRYACQARSIVNRVHKNEDANERVIRELRAEVEKITALREELDRMKRLVENSECQEKQDEIDRLKRQLLASEDTMAKSRQSWSDRLKHAETLKSAELQYLKRCGIAIEFHWDNQDPCLVNLAADPILSGTLMYLLPPGKVVIGRTSDSPEQEQPDIGLTGPLVQPQHCEMENRQKRLFLKPREGCDTYVNGQVVRVETELKHGDRVVIGGIHYFRLSNPGKTDSAPSEVIDFEFAHQEMLRVQEQRLRTELEVSKQIAIRELEDAKAEVESRLGAQRCQFEQQMNEMITVVEMQTNALHEERKLKNELEVERNVLQARVDTHEHCKAITVEEKENLYRISPYKSTFLEDLKSTLSESNLEIELYSDAGGEVSLHEMQMMVQEGTQRCKELGIEFEFSQQQVVDVDGLEPIVIKVVDKQRRVAALWRPAKFLVLLGHLRDEEQTEEIYQLLTDPDTKWTVDEDESNVGSISVNTDFLRRQFSQDLPAHAQLVPSLVGDVPEEISSCLAEMKKASTRLFNYCYTKDSSRPWCEKIKKAFRHFEKFVSSLECEDSNKLYPVKSNLKGTLDENGGKCVRFNELS